MINPCRCMVVIDSQWQGTYTSLISARDFKENQEDLACFFFFLKSWSCAVQIFINHFLVRIKKLWQKNLCFPNLVKLRFECLSHRDKKIDFLWWTCSMHLYLFSFLVQIVLDAYKNHYLQWFDSRNDFYSLKSKVMKQVKRIITHTNC